MVLREVQEHASFDFADQVIFRVYEHKGIKEDYETLCYMPFDAFCKLYERVTMHDAFYIEAENEELARQRLSKETRR